MSTTTSEAEIYDGLLNQRPKEAAFDYEDQVSHFNGKRLSRGLLAWCILATAWVGLLAFILLSRKGPPVESFDDPMRAPIEYSKQKFFGLVHEGEFRPFDDPYGESTEDHWNNMLDVSLVRMTPEEAARLPSKTGPVFGEEPYLGGNLEVFHQLHCLNRIRRTYYFPEQNEYNETHGVRFSHIKHCFGYLEQVLKCHFDVGVMSVQYVPETQGYKPNWNIVKSCRNFELIHDWARERKVLHLERLQPPVDDN